MVVVWVSCGGVFCNAVAPLFFPVDCTWFIRAGPVLVLLLSVDLG